MCPLERVKDGKGFVGCVCVEEKECQQQKEVHHSWCPMTSANSKSKLLYTFQSCNFTPIVRVPDNRCIIISGEVK